jgi:hypothetical protein
MRLMTLGTLTCALAASAGAQTFVDSGASGTFSVSNWTPDRYAPAVWQDGATAPNGDTALRMGISNADRRDGAVRAGIGQNFSFWDFQGRTRDTNLSGATVVQAELFIPQSWSTGNIFRDTALWTRNNGDDASGTAFYPTVGFGRQKYNELTGPTFDAANYYDPTINTSQITSSFYTFNTNTGEIVTYAVAPNYGGWNTFRVEDTGSAIFISINGTLVQSYDAAPTSGLPNAYMDLGTEGLKRVFLQSFNFGNELNATTLPDSGYDAYWRNVSVIPTPAAASVLGLGGLLAARRRRR